MHTRRFTEQRVNRYRSMEKGKKAVSKAMRENAEGGLIL